MAKIGLTEGFKLIPEGSHVFRIEKVDYKEEYGKLEVTMVTIDGVRHVERFNLLKANGDVNEGAMNAFSYFAKAALNDFSVQEIDEQDLVGHFLRCTVRHEEVESSKNPGKMVKFVRLDDKEPADGYDDVDIPWETKGPEAGSQGSGSKVQKSFDLDDLLGI